MTTSYGPLAAVVESELYDRTPVPPAARANALAVIAERNRARIDESLDFVRDQPSSVQNVFEYGLKHPGGTSAAEVQEALGLSDKSVKKAHKVLQQRELASFATTYYRGGRTVLWSYDTGLRQRAFVDLDSGKRSDLDSGKSVQETGSPSHDSWITATTCENSPILSSEGGGVTGRECLYWNLSGQEVRSTETHTPPVVARERRRPSRPLATPAWTMPELDAAPVLARYRELIASKGFVVYEDHALPIWHQLTRLVEDHGLATAHEFMDHVERSCAAPYRAKAMETFEHRWWSLDRAAAAPAPITPTETPEARSEDVRARNDRLRALALGGAR